MLPAELEDIHMTLSHFRKKKLYDHGLFSLIVSVQMPVHIEEYVSLADNTTQKITERAFKIN